MKLFLIQLAISLSEACSGGSVGAMLVYALFAGPDLVMLAEVGVLAFCCIVANSLATHAYNGMVRAWIRDAMHDTQPTRVMASVKLPRGLDLPQRHKDAK